VEGGAQVGNGGVIDRRLLGNIKVINTWKKPPPDPCQHAPHQLQPLIQGSPEPPHERLLTAALSPARVRHLAPGLPRGLRRGMVTEEEEGHSQPKHLMT